MSETTNPLLTEDPDREFLTTRVFPAPREAVFRACIVPDIVARWWGPEGFTNTIHHFEPRPGGQWLLTMHAPDGTDFENRWEFVEVVPPERLVLDHLETMHQFRLMLSFEGAAGGTRLTWRMRFDSVEEAEKVRPFVPAANEQNLDRLAAQLQTMTGE